MTNENKSLLNKFSRKLKTLPIKIYQQVRILQLSIFSNVKTLSSCAKINQPTLMVGEGSIILEKCHLGCWPSPHYLSGYIHLEARTPSASIVINNGVWINNNATIIAERSSIHIGANTLIGTEFTVYDSDFHDPHPLRRMAGTHECAPVVIGKNVFIGSRVTILKGVSIGDNSVIGSGSVVTRSLPENSRAAGIPAKSIWQKSN